MDAAYSASAYFDPDEAYRRMGFHVSFLGPYYAIVRLGHPLEESAALAISRAIEATYPGYQRVPQELAEEHVPDLSPNGERLGEATLGGCLFGDSYETSRRYDNWGPGVPKPSGVRRALRGGGST